MPPSTPVCREGVEEGMPDANKAYQSLRAQRFAVRSVRGTKNKEAALRAASFPTTKHISDRGGTGGTGHDPIRGIDSVAPSSARSGN